MREGEAEVNCIFMVNKKKNKVKLLIVTQKVDENDAILGFFHRWVEEFAKHCERVTVICLYEGEHHLPGNVKVLSLGKEARVQGATLRSSGAKRKSGKRSFLARAKYILRFYRYIWRERKNYDAVFVHMNPIYVVLGGVLWRIWKKKIALWYTHKQVDLKLRVAEKLANVIFTASKESFRLPSKKVKIMGHGIDVERFTLKTVKNNKGGKLHIITVGRISPIKDYETLVFAVEILVKKNIPICVSVIGDAPDAKQKMYASYIHSLIKEKNLELVFSFCGTIPNKNLVQALQKADVFVNMSHTGSLDKAILEAMAIGLPVLTSNEALVSILGKENAGLMFEKGDARDFADKIIEIKNTDSNKHDKLSNELRNIVVKNHNIKNLISSLVKELRN